MSDETQGLAAAMTGLNETIAPIREATLGYRQSLIDAGMGKEAADKCAADYHAWVMAMLPGGRQGLGGKTR